MRAAKSNSCSIALKIAPCSAICPLYEFAYKQIRLT
jgi:hypothetical protein